jgi:hypothetical protein
MDIIPLIYEPEIIKFENIIPTMFSAFNRLNISYAKPEEINTPIWQLMFATMLYNNKITIDSSEKGDTFTRWIFAELMGYHGHKIFSRFLKYGATTQYECEQVDGTSRQTYENIMDGMFRFHLAAERGNIKYPGTPGIKHKVHALVCANQQAVIDAQERFLQLKSWERQNQRTTYDPEGERIGKILIEKHLKTHKEWTENIVLPWIKEENINKFDIVDLKYGVYNYLKENDYIIWLRGRSGKADVE